MIIAYNNLEHYSRNIKDPSGVQYYFDISNSIVELQNKLESLACKFAPYDEVVTPCLIISAALGTTKLTLRMTGTAACIRERSIKLGKNGRKLARLGAYKKFSK